MRMLLSKLVKKQPMHASRMLTSRARLRCWETLNTTHAAPPMMRNGDAHADANIVGCHTIAVELLVSL